MLSPPTLCHPASATACDCARSYICLLLPFSARSPSATYRSGIDVNIRNGVGVGVGQEEVPCEEGGIIPTGTEAVLVLVLVPVGDVPVPVSILDSKGCCKHGISTSVNNDCGGF